MLQSCFKLDPSERGSCSELLEHPYFESMRATNDYIRQQADDELQKRREREQRKREPDKIPAPRAAVS